MKQRIALLLALALLLTLTACAAPEVKTDEPGPAPTVSGLTPEEQPSETERTETAPPASDAPPQTETQTEPQTEPQSCGYTELALQVVSSMEDCHLIPMVLTLPDGKGPFPLVVMHHGFGGNKDEGHGLLCIARRLALAGIASIRMDFCGCGGSAADFAQFSQSSAIRDSDDCLQAALNSAPIDPERIGVFGYSNGTAINAIRTAREDNPYCVRVMLAPVIALPEGVDYDGTNVEAALAAAELNGYYTQSWGGDALHIGAQYYRDKLEFWENLETYMTPSIPTLVIYGTNDGIAKPEYSEAYANAVAADVFRVEGADHSYGFLDEKPESVRYLELVAGVTTQYFSAFFSGNPS